MKEFFKKYKIYFISILLGIVAAINMSVATKALDKTNYTIDLKKDTIINNIYINDNKQMLVLFENDDIKADEDNKLTALKDTTLTLTTSIYDKISISFEDDEGVSIKKDNFLQIIDDNRYMYDINKKELIMQSTNLYTILYTLIFAIIFVFCLKNIKNTILKINENKIKIPDLVLFFMSNFIIFLSTIYLLLTVLSIFTLLIIVLYLIYLLYKIKDNMKLENAYIILGVILGLSFMFLIPPFHIPDEATHYTKSYTMFDSKYDNDEGVAKVDSNMGYFMTYYEFTALDYEAKFNGKNQLNQLFNNEKPVTTYEKVYKNTKYASKIAYIPSAIMVEITKKINASPIIIFIMGRMANLLVSIILCYLALRMTLKYKKIIFLVTLIPSFIQASIGFNMDSFTNALSVLIIAYIIKLIYQRENKTHEYVILFVLGLVLAFSKFGFFPIMLLTLLIPNKKIKKINPYILKIFMILSIFLISYNFSARGVMTPSNADYPFYTLPYALGHIGETIRVFLNSFFNNLGSDMLVGHINGFGTYTKYTNDFFITILTVIYGVMLLVNDEKKINLKERIVNLIVAIILIVLPYAAMFFCWTVKGSPAIAGLQPRYFIVALIPLYIALSNNIIDLKVKNKNLIYVGTAVLGFTLSLFTILIGFY